MKAFFFELRLTASVELLHRLPDELFVVHHRGEVAAPSDHQGLAQRGLESMMRLLDDSVLVRAARMNPCRAKPVVVDQLCVAFRQRTSAAELQLVGGGREVVSADHFWRSTQRP